MENQGIKNKNPWSRFRRIFVLGSVMVGLILVGLYSCTDDNGSTQQNQTHKNIEEVSEATINFVKAAVAYESARFDTLSVDDVDELTISYINAGEIFVEMAENMIAGDKQKSQKNGVGEQCVQAAAGVFGISGLDPGVIKELSDLIKETGDTLRALRQARELQHIDGNQYNDLVNKIRVEKPLDGVGIGFSAIMGAGASGLTGSAVTASAGLATAVSLPGLAVIGAVGGTVGYGTYKLWSWYRDDTKVGGGLFIAAATGSLGEPIPATLFAEGANIAIAIDGAAPILLENFPYPDTGHQMHIEINAEDLTQVAQAIDLGEVKNTAPQTVEVCYWQEVATGDHCDQVAYVSGYPTPSQPPAGQQVIVWGSVMPVIADCELHFSIVGTDGYSKSETHTTNAQGQASFSIPGAQAGVIDKVTITAVNGTSYEVTYVFSGSTKDEQNGETIYRR